MSRKNFLAAGILVAIWAGGAHASLSDGLVAHYPLDGDATDGSGNGHDGTIIGNVQPTTDRLGQANAAMDFPGTVTAQFPDCFIDVPDSPDFTLGSNPFTLATWARFDAADTSGFYLMGHDVSGGETNKWILWVGTAFVTLHVNGPAPYPNGGLFPITFSGTSAVVGEWHHFAVRRSANDFAIFLDGHAVATSVSTVVIPDPNSTFQLGTAEQSNTRQFNGALDDVRIYDRALTNTEIAVLAGVPVPSLSWAPRALLAMLLLVCSFQWLGVRRTRRAL